MASRRVLDDLERIVGWYLATAFGRWEGPGVRPFYADPAKVGRFAVDLKAVAARDPDALFQVLVTLAGWSRRVACACSWGRLAAGTCATRRRSITRAMSGATSRAIARRVTPTRGPRAT